MEKGLSRWQDRSREERLGYAFNWLTNIVGQIKDIAKCVESGSRTPDDLKILASVMMDLNSQRSPCFSQLTALEKALETLIPGPTHAHALGRLIKFAELMNENPDCLRLAFNSATSDNWQLRADNLADQMIMAEWEGVYSSVFEERGVFLLADRSKEPVIVRAASHNGLNQLVVDHESISSGLILESCRKFFKLNLKGDAGVEEFYNYRNDRCHSVYCYYDRDEMESGGRGISIADAVKARNLRLDTAGEGIMTLRTRLLAEIFWRFTTAGQKWMNRHSPWINQICVLSEGRFGKVWWNDSGTELTVKECPPGYKSGHWGVRFVARAY
jgi:hypothetical protein